MIRDAAATYDALDRKQLHRLSFMHFARAVPGYIDQFPTRVPPDFYALVAEGVVDVACPCKVDPVPSITFMVPTACVCGRFYVYTGSEVRVAYDDDRGLETRA